MWRAAWLRAWLLGPALLTHRVERSRRAVQRPLRVRPASPESRETRDETRETRLTSQKAQSRLIARGEGYRSYCL
jgi:hypothetical protein